MQTFLPYPSFAESSAVLDTARLGKQRVETLQILRAILLPSYGWQNHPVTRMWRGHIPALTAYGLANVAAWVDRGHTDSTHDLLAEVAPGMDGVDADALAERGLLPPWIGDEEIHRSHRSNLIRKDPDLYGPLFPGTPPDLDYVWPEAGEREPPPDPDAGGRGGGGREPLPEGTVLQVIRPRTDEQAEEWQDEGIVAIGD